MWRIRNHEFRSKYSTNIQHYDSQLRQRKRYFFQAKKVSDLMERLNEFVLLLKDYETKWDKRAEAASDLSLLIPSMVFVIYSYLLY
jgi:hypothetical protein